MKKMVLLFIMLTSILLSKETIDYSLFKPFVSKDSFSGTIKVGNATYNYKQYEEYSKDNKQKSTCVEYFNIDTNKSIYTTCIKG